MFVSFLYITTSLNFNSADFKTDFFRGHFLEVKCSFKSNSYLLNTGVANSA